MINQYLFHYLLNSCAYFGNKTISLELTQSLSNPRFVCKNVGKYFSPCLVSKMSAVLLFRAKPEPEGCLSEAKGGGEGWGQWTQAEPPLGGPTHGTASIIPFHATGELHYINRVSHNYVPPPSPPTYSHVVRFTQPILRTSNIPHHATLNFEVHERVKMMFLKYFCNAQIRNAGLKAFLDHNLGNGCQSFGFQVIRELFVNWISVRLDF